MADVTITTDDGNVILYLVMEEGHIALFFDPGLEMVTMDDDSDLSNVGLVFRPFSKSHESRPYNHTEWIKAHGLKEEFPEG